MKKLFIDLEVISANNGEIFDDEIAKVEYKASRRYLDTINNLFIHDIIKEEDYRNLSNESDDYKDRVLEEIDSEYKDRINFTRIYEVNESTKSIVDYINKVSSIIETYIIFYYNTEREKQQKEMVCKKYFPNCSTIGIRFYEEKYDPNIRRKRTNKARYIKDRLNLKNLDDCMLIDKSQICCDEWSNLKGYSSLYCSPKNEDNMLKNGRQRG